MVAIGLQCPEPMAVILRMTATLSSHRVGIVEPNQSLAVGPVQSERIVEAMRFPRRDWHTRHHEPHLMTALRVHDEYLAVELEERVKGQVANQHHDIWLSH